MAAAEAAAAAPFLPPVVFPLAAGVSPPLPPLPPLSALLPLAWLPPAGVDGFAGVAGFAGVTGFADFEGDAGLVEGPALKTSGADLRGAGRGGELDGGVVLDYIPEVQQWCVCVLYLYTENQYTPIQHE